MEERPDTCTNNYLDKIVERLELPSDYALAKVLKVSPQAVSKMRRGGGLSPMTAVRVAELLGADQPFGVLASLIDEKTNHFDKTGHTDRWAALNAYLKTVKLTFVGALLALVVWAGAPSPSQAATLHNCFSGTNPGGTSAPGGTNLHICGKRRRRLLRWLQARFLALVRTLPLTLALAGCAAGPSSAIADRCLVSLDGRCLAVEHRLEILGASSAGKAPCP